jgi:hypothetical protein
VTDLLKISDCCFHTYSPFSLSTSNSERHGIHIIRVMHLAFFPTIFVGNISSTGKFLVRQMRKNFMSILRHVSVLFVHIRRRQEGKVVRVQAMGEWKYTPFLSKWSKLSALRHIHFTPEVRVPWRPLKSRLFGSQTQPERHARSEDFFYPP